MIRRIVILLYTTLWCIAIGAQQQEQSFISGAVIDDETGDSISFASIVYKGHNVSAVADAWGKYKIERHEGWNITVSAVGYKTRIIAIIGRTRKHLNIRLKPDNKQLEGVTIEPLTPEDPTGIVLPRPATEVREFKGVYDLSGRKVADDHLKPGIYIRDGKKHVSK